MTRISQFLATGAVGALAFGAPASADVTPQQVWDDLEAYFGSLGYAVEASETQDGADLTLADFSIRTSFPEEGSFSLAADRIVLSDRGDGSVALSFPEVMPITMSVAPPEGEAVDIDAEYRQNGMEIVVSGTPEAMVYDYSADMLGLAMTRLLVDGTEVDRDEARAALTVSDMTGRSTMTLGAMRDITQVLNAGEVTYDIAFTDPESGDAAQFVGNLADLSVDGMTALPLETGGDAPVNLFAEGFDGQGTFAYSGGSTRFAVTDETGTTTGESSTETVRLALAASAEAIRYEVESTGMSVTMTPPDMPFPVSVDVAESAFNLTVPMAKSETPKDMALGLTLGGFSMSDVMWSLLDPKQVLPRDPATLTLDLAGSITPYVDFFDPEAMAVVEESGAVPGEINTLTLRDLTVDAAGARLTGTGDFTFDNSDLETYDGMPAPDGSVVLTLEGGNALLDRLIEMGVLAEQDAMGARMMMSMFTVPGEGEDSLTSTLTVKPNGQILANGQRIK